MASAERASSADRQDTGTYRGGLARSLVRTLLILTFIPLILLGGAAYLRARDLLRNQVILQMRSQITDQVEQVSLSIKTKEIRLDRLIRGADFVSAAQRAVAVSPASTELESVRGDLSRLVRSTAVEGGRATFNQYFLMTADGKIKMAGRPEWEGVALKEIPIYPKLTESDRASFAVYDLRPLYPDQLVLLTVAECRNPDGSYLGTVVGITESRELQDILHNLATPSSGAEALFVTPDSALIGTDPYTNQMRRIDAPSSQMTPIMAALNPMMDQPGAVPATVEFPDQEGTRFIGQVLWLDSLHTGIVYQIAESRVLGALTSLIPFTIAVFLASVLAMGLILSIGARRVFRPLVTLAEITSKFSEGDFSQRAVVRTKDEIGLLGQSFNHMAEELTGLYRSLEQKVEERTRQIRTAAEVAERITSTTNLGELLNRTVQLIIEQFNFYHASVFLLDRGARFAVLQAAHGPAAAEMLSRGHRLEVGSGSIIGWVTAHNQARIAADVATDPMHLKNELLPETRSEAGIPISAGGMVLGAIDVQSTQARAFGPETIVMLQTIANQIAAAIQNVGLVESSQMNLQELERLYAASREIVTAQSRQQALGRTAEVIAQATYPALVLAVDGDRLEMQGRADPQKPDLAAMLQALPSLETHLAEIKRFVSGGSVIVEPSSLGLPLALLDFTHQVGFRSVAFLPINHREDLAAIVVVGSPKRPLSRVLIEPYAHMADLVGTTLDRLSETEERERQLAERDSLTAIGQAIARTSAELEGFFTELHAQVRKNIGDYSLMVALYDPAHESISIPFAYEDGAPQSKESFPMGEGLTSIVVRTRQPLLLDEDVERRAQKLGAQTAGKSARTWMGAPMLVQDSAIGALVLQDMEHEHAFEEKHLRFFVALANQVASVLHNARLLDEGRKHAFQLETAAEIARDISGSLNLDELLAKSVNYLRDRFGYYHASVFLIDPKREFAVIREATGEAGLQLKRSAYKLAVGSRSIVGFVAGRGEPLIVSDTSRDATYYQHPLLPDTRSEAAIPLRVGERIVGVMDVQSNQPYAFQQDDVRTLQILADQLAVAVVNAELFAETQEHLSQHRLLHHITTSAASGTTLEEALNGAVAGLQVSLGGDRVSILLADRAARTLEIKAASGYSEEVLRLQIPIGTGITGWSAAHARALRVDDTAADSRYIEGSPNTRSELAVPLIYRNEVLGVLNVESEEVGAYTQNDEEMLGTLAGSLAAVIANARLLEQVRAQAEREREVFEITSKIRRAPDIRSILATTASELTRVVGARRAQIMVSAEETSAPGKEE